MRGTDSALLAASAPTNFGAMGIESDGDLTKVNLLDGNTPQTADHTAAIAAIPTTAMRGTDGANTTTPPTAIQNADALLNRDMGAVSDTNSRTPLNALRWIRNRFTIIGSVLSVKKEDDSTEAWASTLSTDATADPITGSDPA